ncbi:hypothetical protein [Comamonas sp. NLF-1-9]|uniref:hypothetical protein n=1 Tax=Comamonas sp. NLF-1-9 TaxID=2853163 RepID=UPI001C476352|nr:hypothetical protein [Comamonas sp. NLF-1-9]QXL83156.1 hypothetical protein KUD94_07640 [Comamonas sp. NLF-1-9]
MATKKITKTANPGKPDPNAFKVEESKDTMSQTLAKLVTGGALSATTLKQFSGGGENLDVSDLVAQMKKAGDEVVTGDMRRVERMLSNQMLTLDLLFNTLAQKSGRQDTFKGIEVLLRLALKAQAQARATAETLSIVKNPMPYIRQANIAHGPQQVNNGASIAGAGNSQSEPDKLLEQQHGNVLDTRAQTAASRIDPAMETVGAQHRPEKP